MDAFEPRSPVEVRAVVRLAIEGDELPAGLLAQAQQELVEDLTPGPGVQGGAVGEDTVEVEEAGADRRRAGRASVAHWHRRQPRQRPDAGRSGPSSRASQRSPVAPARAHVDAPELGRGERAGGAAPSARSAASSASCQRALIVSSSKGRGGSAADSTGAAAPRTVWATGRRAGRPLTVAATRGFADEIIVVSGSIL